MQTANATFTVFDADGRPVRATVNITMSEVPPIPPPTNPTSGSPGGGETTLVREHDTLAGIAHRQYGDAGLWRGIAAANNITDPMSLKPGQRLLLPAQSAVKELS
jgi:nucleoid-associated protein YgaU